MTKRRDAGTGQYISDETAKSLPKNLWVEENDDRQVLLRNLYEALLARAGYAECEDFESIKVSNVKLTFEEFGLKING